MHNVSECKSCTILKMQFIGKRIRDAALSTFIHHYTFVVKSKSITI